MSHTTSSTIIARLARNLEYKLTYLEIYRAYLAQGGEPEAIAFIQALIDRQKDSIASLSSRLRQLDYPVRQLAPLEKLKAQAFARRDTAGKLQFVQAGLERSAAWYGEQLLDPEMRADAATRQLLIDLGQVDAAALWYANALLRELAVAQHGGHQGAIAGSTKRTRSARRRDRRSPRDPHG
jgi:hypothetical protein